jgi:hypothetical protein
MVHSVRGRAEPFPRDDVIAELTALREGLKESRMDRRGHAHQDAGHPCARRSKARQDRSRRRAAAAPIEGTHRALRRKPAAAGRTAGPEPVVEGAPA